MEHSAPHKTWVSSFNSVDHLVFYDSGWRAAYGVVLPERFSTDSDAEAALDNLDVTGERRAAAAAYRKHENLEIARLEDSNKLLKEANKERMDCIYLMEAEIKRLNERLSENA